MPPVGSQDQEVKADKHVMKNNQETGISMQGLLTTRLPLGLTALATHSLARDNQQGPGQARTRDRMLARTVTVRDIQKTQTHCQCQATDRLGPIRRAAKSLHVASQGKGLDVQGLSATR